MAQIDKQLTIPLFAAGLRGEGLRGKDVWVTQTYFPGLPNCAQYRVQKVILLARNPFDAYFSMFNMLVRSICSSKPAPSVIYINVIKFMYVYYCAHCTVYSISTVYEY